MRAIPKQIGDYRILEELGRGSMGVVLKGEAPDGTLVAIKVFNPSDDLSPGHKLELHDRFLQEARILSEIDHPNVVHVLASGHTDGSDYMVMEFVEGFNLKELAQMGRRFTVEEAVDIIRQVLLGLDAIHRHGVVHRDIKPSNIILRPDGTAVITDFGIARKLTEKTLARGDHLLGTPAYMAPEQITGGQVDHRADIYSAGVVLYELLTGERAFPGDISEALYRVVNEDPADPRSYRPEISTDLVMALEKALAKDPARRFASALDFYHRLERARLVEPSPEPAKGALSTGALKRSAKRPSDRDQTSTPLPSPSPPSPSPTAPPSSGSLGILLGSGALDPTAQLSTREETIYCTYCGMPNPVSADSCARCRAPLVKPPHLTPSSGFVRPADYRVDKSELYGCLNLILLFILVVAVLILLFL